MVEIIKGSKTLIVPVGAYKTAYAPAGWEIKGKDKTPDEPVKSTEKIEKEPEIVEETEDFEVEDEEDVVYVDPEELAEKPLEELDFEELKILAEYKGIDVTGLRSSKALKKAIKSLE